jgi:DNA-binding protein H-NS
MEGNMARAAQGSEPQDLDSMSDEELQALRERVNGMLDERVRNRFAEYQRIARDAGYEVTLTKIGEEGRRRRGRMSGRDDRRSEIAPKYRNPENPSETWSGRGREPKWLQHQIAAGKSKEDFLIDRQESRQPAA